MTRADMLAIIVAIEEQLADLKAQLIIERGTVPAKSPPKQKRNARIPEDWEPDAVLIEWARNGYPNVDPHHETAKFRDYWVSAGTARANWSAAYRNWIRKAAEFASSRPSPLHAGRSAQRTAAISEANRATRNRVLDKLASLRPGTNTRQAQAEGDPRFEEGEDGGFRISDAG